MKKTTQRGLYLLNTLAYVAAIVSPALFLNVGRSAAYSGDGDGSATWPYRIDNCVQLQEMNNNLSAHYVLAQNIDCSDTVNWNGGNGFVPIGDTAHPFTGTFEGNGSTIDGLTINNPSLNFVGLFGRAASGATIQHLNLANEAITGGQNVGGLIGEVEDSHINYVGNSGTIHGDNIVGGLIGAIYNGNGPQTISFTSSAASATATDVSGEAGGLIADYFDGDIQDSYATGNVSADTIVGGLVGGPNTYSIERSYSTGDVTSTDVTPDIGGLIGFSFSATAITDSFTTSAIHATNATGGFVGSFGGFLSNLTPVTNSYFDQTKSGTANCSGGHAALSGHCEAVNTAGSDNNHFKNTTAVHPFNNGSWDFLDDWQQTSDYPAIRGLGFGPLPPLGAPASPANLVATPHNTYANLGWDVPDTGGSPITSYHVQYKLHSASTWSDWGVDPTTNAVTVTGLSAQTSYDFQVSASSVRAVGDYSSVTTATTAQTFVITNCIQLQAIQDFPTADYILANDIDCSGSAGFNGADGFEPITGFTGSLDGQNHAIKDLSIIANSDNVAIFADATGVRITNLKIDGPGSSIEGNGNSGALVGALDSSFVDNITSNEGVRTNGSQDGGLFGLVTCEATNGATTLSNIKLSGTLRFQAGSDGFGGLVGELYAQDSDCPITIQNVTNSGDITALTGTYTSDAIGGLVGQFDVDSGAIATMDNVSSTGDITFPLGFAGGIIGSIDNNGGTLTISQAFSTGDVTADPSGEGNVGGLIGQAYGSTTYISQSYATGNVSGQNNVGGLIGDVEQDVELNDVYATGSVTGNVSSGQYTGGLIGSFGNGSAPNPSLTNSYATGSVSGDSYVGGLVGIVYGAVNNSFATGAVTTVDSSSTGGLFGIYDPLDGGASTHNAYDVSRTGQATCAGSLSDGDCASDDVLSVNTVSSPAPNYFFNSTTNPPLDQWGFSYPWSSRTSNYPLLYFQLGETTAHAIPLAHQITVYWDVPTGAQAPQTFEARYQKDGDSTWTNIPIADISAPRAVVTGLQPSTWYNFEYRLSNQFGSEDWLGFTLSTLADSTSSSTSAKATLTTIKDTSADTSDSAAAQQDVFQNLMAKPTNSAAAAKASSNTSHDTFYVGLSLLILLSLSAFWLFGRHRHSS